MHLFPRISDLLAGSSIAALAVTTAFSAEPPYYCTQVCNYQLSSGYDRNEDRPLVLVEFGNKPQAGKDAHPGALKAYKNQIDQRDAVSLIYDVGRATTATALDVYGAGAASAFVDLGLEKLQDQIVAKNNEYAKELLEGALEDMKARDAATFSAMPSMTETERLAAASAALNTYLSKEVVDGIDGVHQATAIANIQRTLNDNMIKVARQNAEQTSITQMDVKDAFGRITKVEEAAAQMKDEMANDVQLLKEGQQALLDSVELIQNNVSMNSYDIEAIQKVMFGAMSPKDQKDALVAGFFRRMPDDKKAELQLKVEKAAARQELTETITMTLTGVKSALKFAEALGVDADVVQKANTAVNFASAAFNIATSWGNPMAMLSAFGGAASLFGGQSDPGAARHAQVMEKLGLIHNEIKELRKQVEEMRVQMHQRFDALEERLDRQHAQLLESQVAERDAISMLSEQLDQLLTADLIYCFSFDEHWRNKTSTPYSHSELVRWFNPPTSPTQVSSGVSSEFGYCRKGLQETSRFNDAFASAVVFKLGNGLKNQVDLSDAERGQILSKKEAEAFTANYFDPSYAWFSDNPLFIDTTTKSYDDVMIGLLALPVQTQAEAQIYIGVGATAPATQDGWRNKVKAGATQRPKQKNLRSLFDAFLSENRITKVAPLAVGVSGMMDMMNNHMDSQPRMLTKEQLRQRASFPPAANNAGLELVQQFLLLTTVALAQENMVSGPFMLEWLVSTVDAGLRRDLSQEPLAATDKRCRAQYTKTVNGKEISVVDDYARAICMLERNPILRFNFSIAWAQNRLRLSGRDSKDLGTAQAITAPYTTIDKPDDLTGPGSWIQWALGDAPFVIQTSDGKTEFALALPSTATGAKLYVTVPKAANVRSGSLYFRQSRDRLIDTRKMLATHLGFLTMHYSLSTEESRYGYDALVYAHGELSDVEKQSAALSGN
ncbi:MAG: hypothetical protein V4607_09680 [Pseudomonadota bacterium]